MRYAVTMFLVAALLIPAAAIAGKKHSVVGGPCAYDEFGGYCTVTGRDKSGRSIFTFVGQMNGSDVHLENNAMMDGMSVLKGSMACKLLFIKKGTCTPCAFSIGECGEKAWDLFRASGKAKKSR